jgi:glycosyltransferase involved in cell wall biosynthesis
MATLPIPETLAPGEKLIVAVGRLVEQKGYPVLLRAFAQVRKTANARLWILGEGPLRVALKKQARELQLSEAVRFLGFRSNPYAYMARADVFVLSSHWEGFGNVIVEAMASGTAVVAADCPYGPREVVEDGISGRLVPPGDAEALAANLSEVLHDSGLRAQLVAGGLTRAHDFSSEVIAARWHKLIAQILSERAPNHHDIDS